MAKKKSEREGKISIGGKVVDLKELSFATTEELEVLLSQIQRNRDDAFREFERTETIIRKTLRVRQRGRGSDKRVATLPVESYEVGLPIPPIVVTDGGSVGDVNLLTTQVSLVSSPFDRIIMNLAENHITRTGGLMPTMEIQSVKKGNEDEICRIITKWQLKRPVSQEELSGICHVSQLSYGQEVKRYAKAGGWDDVNYEDVHGKSVAGKRAIYLGPQNYFSSSATGVIISRKFPTAAEANFLIQTRPKDWIASSASGTSLISTEVELREGPKDDEHPGISQENFLELVVQISYLLANQKLIQRRVLMTSIFRELNRVGTANIEREKLFGMKSILGVIERVLLFPLQQPGLSKSFGFRPESVLLTGVPGVGKTLLAHFLMAGDYNAIFASIDSSRLHQDLKSSGEKGVSWMLVKMDKVREITQLPVILLIDDIDVVLKEDEILSKFLNLMQGIREKGLYLIASTNHPEKIDERLMEPGRLSKIIHAPLPNREDREGVLRVHLVGRPFGSDDEREKIIARMADLTEGWTQRYLWELCVEASRLCGLEIVGSDISKLPEGADIKKPISFAHFEKARADLIQRINLKRLQKRDKEIRDFVSQTNRAMGFI